MKVEEPSAAISRPLSNIRWTQIYPTIMMFWIISFIDKSNISIVMANHTFLRDLHLVGQSAKLGFLTTSFLIPYAIFMPFWGWVIRRTGVRRVGIGTTVLWILTTAAMGTVSDYTALAWLRALLGFAEAASWPLTFTVVSQWFALRERARAQTMEAIGAGIAIAIGGILTTSLVLASGWRGQFYWTAVIAAVIVLPLFIRFLRDDPNSHPRIHPTELAAIADPSHAPTASRPVRLPTTSSLGQLLGSYPYWLTVLIWVGNNIFFWGLGVWFPSYVRATDHFSFAQAGYLTTVVWICVIIALLIFSTMSDRLLRRGVFVVLGYVGAAIFLVLGSQIHSVGFSIVCFVLAWCGQQTALVALQGLNHHVIRPQDIPFASGLQQGIGNLAGAFSPALIGIMVAAAGGSFAGGFLVLAVSVLVSGGAAAIFAFQGY